MWNRFVFALVDPLSPLPGEHPLQHIAPSLCLNTIMVEKSFPIEMIGDGSEVPGSGNQKAHQEWSSDNEDKNDEDH